MSIARIPHEAIPLTQPQAPVGALRVISPPLWRYLPMSKIIIIAVISVGLRWLTIKNVQRLVLWTFAFCNWPWQVWVWVRDRKSTRLNSSHVAISYAVFCLKKKNKIQKYK